MSLRVLRCADGAQFLALAGPFLAAQEAENCLPYAIANQLSLYPAPAEQPAYLAYAEAEGAVLAAAVMTPPRKLLLALTDSRAAVVALAADVRDFRPDTPGVNGLLPVSEWFAEEWQALTGEAFELAMSDRLYKLTQVKHPAGVAGRARRAGGSDRDRLIEWFAAFDLDAFGAIEGDPAARVDNFLEMSTRGLFLWEDGAAGGGAGGAVAMAGFGGFTPHSARIGPVYTPPKLRGHGYASALTAHATQHLLDGGRQFVTLFTNADYATPNHIYQTIGYVPVRDVADFKFSPSDRSSQ